MSRPRTQAPPKALEPGEKLLTPDEVAEQLRCHASGIRVACRDGRIKATRAFGRKWLIPQSELTRLIDEGWNRTTDEQVAYALGGA